MQTPVTAYLERLGIGYELRPHSNPVFTSEDAARERNVRLSQIAKTMIARDKAGTVHVALVPGDRSLDLKKLRRAAGDKGIGLMNPTHLAEEFGLTVGAISPIQLIELGARFYMDPTLLDEEYVDISSGDPGAGVEVTSEELRRILNATVCEIASDRRPPAHGG